MLIHKGYLLIMLLIHMNLTLESTEDKETLKEAYRNLSRVNFSMATATDSNAITYKLYTKDKPDTAIFLREETVARQNVDKNITTILLIHGWNADDTSPWYGAAKKNYFQKGSYSVIYINWSTYGNLSFEVSAANVKPVGKFIANFLKNSLVPAENIHLIGHSLGAQLAAFIGKSYRKMCDKSIGRISGLDPSGRKFSNKDMRKEERLSELDADFVDIIHTNIQMRGFTKPCGHVDFYPNGGADQPGCSDQPGYPYEETERCNHNRARLFFAESIHTSIEASEISFKEDENYNVMITPKKHPKKCIFGEYVNLKARGVYYLNTNSAEPFLG